MNKYPLALSSWGQEEIAAIHRVIESDLYSMGPQVAQFEKDFAEYLNVPHCVMVNSGSSANLLAIAALFFVKKSPLKRGDEVIVPAVSWATTYTPLQQYGLKCKFVDIDRETLNFDLDKLQNAVTNKTRLIVAVNLLGNCNDFLRIKEIMGDKNIYLFEDNCESLRATFMGQQGGTFGVMGSFSTFFSHHMSTMEGGMICCYDEEVYHILLSLRSHGWTRHLPKKNQLTGEKSDRAFEESFKFILPGYNLRPVEMSGAIGIEQLKKLPEFVRVRRENAQYFLERIAKISWLETQREVGESSWFGFSLLLKEGAPITRDQLVDELEAKGIDCRPVVAGNFAKNKVIEYFDHEVHEDLSAADDVDKNGFFVGNHHVSMKESIDYLIEILSLY